LFTALDSLQHLQLGMLSLAANEGLPLNPRLALFYQNKPDATHMSMPMLAIRGPRQSDIAPLPPALALLNK
jgi:hypothetical protein